MTLIETKATKATFAAFVGEREGISVSSSSGDASLSISFDSLLRWEKESMESSTHALNQDESVMEGDDAGIFYAVEGRR